MNYSRRYELLNVGSILAHMVQLYTKIFFVILLHRKRVNFTDLRTCGTETDLSTQQFYYEGV